MLRSGNPHDNAHLQEVDVDEVAVPRIQFNSCDNLLTLLNTQVDLLQHSDGLTFMTWLCRWLAHIWHQIVLTVLKSDLYIHV